MKVLTTVSLLIKHHDGQILSEESIQQLFGPHLRQKAHAREISVDKKFLGVIDEDNRLLSAELLDSVMHLVQKNPNLMKDIVL